MVAGGFENRYHKLYLTVRKIVADGFYFIQSLTDDMS
jgi:hypothetical protein